ncbi:hypothetical protein RHSIM_Rhsim07G0177000 [Rhododendron simsii]|uniref:Shikimate dehydrogenase n=1 Tax=Rhododendron simsii TaxID=118357 RepID=A0A834GSJ5_RHOSS|nr:hypothetical protein RHSIM_Rhsim07G0177000 [Rhododendron simsii]
MMKRQDALRLAVEFGAYYIDVELKVADEFTNSIFGKKPEKFKVVVSSHNFHNTPSTEDIGNLVARMQAAGADIVKIATTALDITDVARVFQITVHSQLAGKQLQIKDLLDLYNFKLIKPDTKVYGIIGKPVGHSKSPLLFNEALKKVGLNSVYVHLLVDDVKRFFNTYSSMSICWWMMSRGSSTPIHLLILLDSDGTLKSYNTDYIGAISAIEDRLRELNGSIPAVGSPLAGKLFVVLGAGGAGKSLAYGAQQKGARVVVANRTFEAKELAEKVGGEALTLQEVNDFHPEEGMILANTTSVGMKPNINSTPISKVALFLYFFYSPRLPKVMLSGKYNCDLRVLSIDGLISSLLRNLQEALKHYDLVFDAIYTPKDTRLLREAREFGKIIVYGTEMLIRQGFEQYKNFTGLPAPEDLFRELMSRHA